MKIKLFMVFMLLMGLFTPNYKVHAENTYTQSGGEVHYNWGTGSPSGIQKDNFNAVFDQSRTFSAGDYFIQTLADDRVKVEVDGQFKINRWTDAGGVIDRALWTGVTAGSHQVKTHFYENKGNAVVFSDVVKSGDWLAYYYPNTWAGNAPVHAKVISGQGINGKLSEDFGLGSPAAGKIGTDNFTAKYVTAKKLTPGEYVIRTRADDGIRVYVDGKLALDRWTSSDFNTEDSVKINVSSRTDQEAQQNPAVKDMHWIEVVYLEKTGGSKVEFDIAPYSQVKSTDGWVGEIFPNTNLSGNPVIIGGEGALAPLNEINFNWGNESPQRLIGADNFSGRFTKKLQVDQQGAYLFKVWADDGVRLYVDGNRVIDSWIASGGDLREATVALSPGEHEVKIEYYEGTGNSLLKFSYENAPFTQNISDVNYNWGAGSPEGYPIDNFKAIFDQSQTFSAGDYFIQTLADDGIRVQVDGQYKIDNWTDGMKLERALWPGVTQGNHQVKTYYYENAGDAVVFSNIVRSGDWLAYYYPNTWAGNAPVHAKVISGQGINGKLSEDFGLGSPAAGKIGTDNFTAKYVTAKKLTPGEYVIRTRADDGIRVYVDGKLALDRWTSSDFNTEDSVKINVSSRTDQEAQQNPAVKDMHWIEVVYLEKTGGSKVEFDIAPYSQVKSTDGWVGEIYPNTNLSGNPVIIGGEGALASLNEINFNWGNESPQRLIGADNFSGRFTKKLQVDQPGTYQFKLWADDGVRLYVDGKKVIDSWQASGGGLREASVQLSAGNHEVKIEYYEGNGNALLKLDIIDDIRFISAINLPVYRDFLELSDFRQHLTFYNPSYTRLLELKYGDSVKVLEENSYGAKVRTSNNTIGWVHKDYLELSLTDDWWLVKDDRTFRTGPGVDFSSTGRTIYKGEKVKVLEYLETQGIYTQWYKIETIDGRIGWIWGALSTDGNQGYNLIKYEFDKEGRTTNNLSVFTPLETSSSLTIEKINAFIASKTGYRQTLMTGMGDAYLEAQQVSGLNAYYLVAHSALETSWGNSAIVKTKYNYYGIGAIDSQPAQGAYTFDTPEGGIIAGAIWINKGYVSRSEHNSSSYNYSQPTLDNMRWDNSWHQYAADEAWAVKISKIANELHVFNN
jgi:beta-N-acetylglucosaminidase